MASVLRIPRSSGRCFAALTGLGVALNAPAASACGGFFCGQQPVAQTAERILFEVAPDSVTMTTQISFTGDAADFAWILPLSAVPDPSSLAVYHQQALNTLDANSAPVFIPPPDENCSVARGPIVGGYDAEEDSAPGVTVYIRQEVGDYDVAVIESGDPALLIGWLREQGFRITAAMEPYIERYTSEGLKFLALKLQDAATVQDIKPFRFTLPGTAPSIPLRMTALAAEPEMAIVVFVLADRRYEGKNWASVDIADDQIRFRGSGYGYANTNWSALVAQAVDAAGGQGWVTEYAGPSEAYADQVRSQMQNGNFRAGDDALGAAELLAALEAHPYLTRLSTRLSAEEMISDPVFGQSSLGDVAREHQLSRTIDGVDQCAPDGSTSPDPCDFETCGAGGLCRRVTRADYILPLVVAPISAGCACVPGATARVTRDPNGAVQVLCQDGRMSFSNPGDRETEASEVIGDACAGFDCGEHGQCVAMDLKPTCVCDQGFVAIGGFRATGAPAVRCTEPDEPVPATFYEKRLQALPPELPGGRAIEVPAVLPLGPSNAEGPSAGGFPMPRREARDGGCGVAGRTPPATWLLGLGLALSGLHGRRRSRERRAPS